MKFTLQLYLGLAWICIVSMVFGYGAWGHIGALGKRVGIGITGYQSLIHDHGSK